MSELRALRVAVVNKNFFLSLLCFFAATLLFASGMLAADSQKLVDVRDILKKADAVKFQNGVTKITYDTPKGAGSEKEKRTATAYYYKNKEGDEFEYRESVTKTSTRTRVYTIIIRPDGDWSLYPGVAVRIPGDASPPRYYGMKPVLGTVEDCMEENAPCVRVVIDASPDNQTPSMRRYEFLISKDSGMIIRRRGFSKDGKILLQFTVTTIEKNYDFPVANFEIPKDRTMLFPDNQSEYAAIIRKYVSRATKTKNQPKRKTQ
jgi:hypothetical protein